MKHSNVTQILFCVKGDTFLALLCKIASILKQNMAILAVRKMQIYTLKIPGNGVLKQV
jgi:hypothetical protein